MSDPSEPTPTQPHTSLPPRHGIRTALTAWDESASDWIGIRLPHPRWFTKPFGYFSITGNHGVVWYVIAALGAWAATGDAELAVRRFAYASGAVLACQGITFFVKLGVGRRRPVDKDPADGQYIREPRSPSFPSSHASMGATGVLTLGALYPAWVWAFLALAFALTCSRVYLRVHYVLDVLAGLALGTVFGFAVVLLIPPP